MHDRLGTVPGRRAWVRILVQPLRAAGEERVGNRHDEERQQCAERHAADDHPGQAAAELLRAIRAAEDADGVLASSVGVPLTSMTSAASFLAAYEKAGFAHPSSPYGPYAYDAANAIIRSLPAALNNQTSPSAARSVLLKALMTVTFNGASGDNRDAIEAAKQAEAH